LNGVATRTTWVSGRRGEEGAEVADATMCCVGSVLSREMPVSVLSEKLADWDDEMEKERVDEGAVFGDVMARAGTT
jgi:hypothetical protein